jgi:hypothetical protein
MLGKTVDSIYRFISVICAGINHIVQSADEDFWWNVLLVCFWIFQRRFNLDTGHGAAFQRTLTTGLFGFLVWSTKVEVAWLHFFAGVQIES